MREILTPKVRISRVGPLVTLGSRYGGWTFVDGSSLDECLLLSCGLGEDASFDVEFAARYNATVVFVDPTPRAIAHFTELISHLGQQATRPLVKGGCQPVDAYDLSSIKPGQMQLLPVAVSDSRGEAKFFAPPNSDHVSHSLINFQGGYKQEGSHIIVDTVPLEELINKASSEKTVLKMDIEGAEIRAIASLLRSCIRPCQILVEFDELAFPSLESRARFKATHKMLLTAGYRLVYFDARTCCTYVYPSFRPRQSE